MTRATTDLYSDGDHGQLQRKAHPVNVTVGTDRPVKRTESIRCFVCFTDETMSRSAVCANCQCRASLSPVLPTVRCTLPKGHADAARTLNPIHHHYDADSQVMWGHRVFL